MMIKLAGWDTGQNRLAGRLECRWLLEDGWICLNENLGRRICCYATVHKEVRFGLVCILTNSQRVESKAMLLFESRMASVERLGQLFIKTANYGFSFNDYSYPIVEQRVSLLRCQHDICYC